MQEKITLKAMRCPSCGGNLKAENSTDPIVCVYCGDTIVPVKKESGEARADRSVDLRFRRR